MVHANEKDSFEDDPTDAAKAKLKQSGKTLVKTEEREEGSVEGSAYMHYAKAGGLWAAFLSFVVQAFGRASEIGSGFWLAHSGPNNRSRLPVKVTCSPKEKQISMFVYMPYL